MIPVDNSGLFVLWFSSGDRESALEEELEGDSKVGQKNQRCP